MLKLHTPVSAVQAGEMGLTLDELTRKRERAGC